MLYLDTFGASGGLGRCTIELLPALAERLDRVVLAGQSHVVDSYRDQLSETEKLRFWNLEHPRFHPGALLLRLKAKKQPGSTAFTETLLRRAGIRSRNSHPVLINYPQAIAPPRKDFGFDTFIHDLNWRHFPGNFPDPEALDHRCADWIRKSRRIFTNSDFTRQEIIEAYRIEPGRVISAPLAPPAKSPAFSEAETQDALKRASLKPDGFFFYPAAHGLHRATTSSLRPSKPAARSRSCPWSSPRESIPILPVRLAASRSFSPVLRKGSALSASPAGLFPCPDFRGLT
jgi:hypothetical protein